ncbi:hypothetical protein QRX60_16930 [Amycolatopsis mongoliensis]|uniref:Uncharacterized protein n=1 Tax=Amycolatopsis mongoliensis TaxID=715475 RepID=A0A9Y2JVH5_9PSEU|nr:hypothetical protein [Amycolatopsis sp. 4-36]WIY05443.1 hypothetical protein QRX60_16930 [Amycolatopsis sp. 4-36]
MSKIVALLGYLFGLAGVAALAHHAGRRSVERRFAQAVARVVEDIQREDR